MICVSPHGSSVWAAPGMPEILIPERMDRDRLEEYTREVCESALPTVLDPETDVGLLWVAIQSIPRRTGAHASIRRGLGIIAHRLRAQLSPEPVLLIRCGYFCNHPQTALFRRRYSKRTGSSPDSFQALRFGRDGHFHGSRARQELLTCLLVVIWVSSMMVFISPS